jgi:molybdopterin-synthase adenylyltransferase
MTEPSTPPLPHAASAAGRFVRQERLWQVGAAGQAALGRARVVIVGIGATGSHLAESLARAGVGRREHGGWLRLVDRDIVELSNLPRQTLFTTADADAVAAKAGAACAALAAIDPGLDVSAHVSDLTADNAARMLAGAGLVLDGTDNFSTRFLLNDWCVQQRVPFLYCGVVGTEGQALLVRPGGPCLRCYVPQPPAPGSLPTCDTAGVLGTAVSLVTALAAGVALRHLLEAPTGPGTHPAADPEAEVLAVDGWEPELRRLRLPREPDCPCCVRGEFPFLHDAPAATATELCGRDAVQLPATGPAVDLPALAAHLAAEGAVSLSPFLVRLDLPPRAAAGAGAAGDDAARRILVFRDGRVIVGGTRDPAQARTIRARLLGE